MQPSDYQNIGQYMRESRESLRVSIEQAAQALHIRPKYLESLEAGELSDLPGKSYTRGYIRNYAQYLGLDVDKVLEGYGLLGPKIAELFIPEPTHQQNLPSRWLVWLSLIGLILLYGCWYFAFHDHTKLKNMVAELPESIAHLLDKPALAAMDKPVSDCLSGGDAGCLVILRVHASLPPLTTPLYATLYDKPAKIQANVSTDDSSQEP